MRRFCRWLVEQPPAPRVTRAQLTAARSLADLPVPRRRLAPPPLATETRYFADATILQQHLDAWRQQRRGAVVLFHAAEYPPLLREIAQPPLGLFVEGDVGVLQRSAIAIVGARAASADAKRFTHALAADLAQAGWGIASGLARGIDAAAHRGALDAAGTTVAVVGNGTDVCYPPENRDLQRRIVAGGVVASELPPSIEPRAWHFPRRNRILAGLVRGVVVVQAEQKSGALITARYALDENRDVLAVPGDVGDPRSRGPHELLRQGAVLVESATDVVQALGWPQSVHTADRRAVLSLLEDPCRIEALRDRLGWSAEAVQRVVSELEVWGAVARDRHGRYRRA